MTEVTNDEGRMTEGPYELPAGWVWTTVGAVAKDIGSGFASGKHNQEGVGVPHFRPMNISPTGEVDMSVIKSVETATYDRLLAGDVVFNNTNSPALLGKTTRISQDTNWAYSNHMTRIRPQLDVIEPGWLSHYLQHLHYVGYYRINARNHVNQSSINAAQLAGIYLPLAPLQKQRRIVAKIEELLSSLDAGVASLKRVQAALKRYRAAVLKAACEGRLVPQDPSDEPAEKLLERILVERRAKWEADLTAKGKDTKKAKYEEPKGPETDGLPELPEGWCWATLEQLSWDSGYGTSQKCDYEALGPPVLRIPNIASGNINLQDLKRATDGAALSLAGALAPNDLLIIRTNGSKDLIGRSAIVRQPFPNPHFFASYLIRYRLSGGAVLAQWLSTLWNADLMRKQLERMAATSAGQYNVSLGSLNKLAIPLGPEKLQSRIVAEAERRLSVVAELGKLVEANLVRAERLRQAILRRAFEGGLVM